MPHSCLNPVRPRRAARRCAGPELEGLEPRQLLTRVPGLDVSQFQGALSWPLVFSGGKRFAFIRSSRTDTNLDANFIANITNATKAGILAGPYQRVLPLGLNDAGSFTDPVTDANRFVTAAGAYMTTGYLRPVVDVEDGASLGKTALTTWVMDFIAEVRRLTGIECTIYTPSGFADFALDSRVTSQRLWISNWSTAFGDPLTGTGSPPLGPWDAAGKTWNFWQYTSTGTIPRIGGTLDLDVYNGDLATLQSTEVIQPPEITVISGSGDPVTSGQTDVLNVGSADVNSAGPTLTITVSNDGESALTLGSLSVPAGFTVVDGLAGKLLSGQSDTLTLQLDTSAAGVFSGQVSFGDNDPDEAPFNFSIRGTVTDPLAAPTCGPGSFDYQSADRPLSFTFSKDVSASLSVADLVVTNLDTMQAVSATDLDYDGLANTARFVLPPLPDGNYHAVLSGAGVSDTAGHPLAADGIGDFFVLTADANHDRTVDTLDFNALAANFGGSGKQYAQGDFNFDTVVDTLDFNALAGQFGKSMPAAPSLSRAAPAPAAPFASGAASATITTVGAGATTTPWNDLFNPRDPSPEGGGSLIELV